MNIAIIGYGKMGKEIEKIALERNHNIVFKLDISNKNEFTKENLNKADVAIEFSTPETAYYNIVKCMNVNLPVISGTTGWLEKIDEIKSKCNTENKAFFYASNYSVGVNIFFKLNEFLARIMNNQQQYNVDVEEIHHTQKLDAPSGTAITIAEGLLQELERKNQWSKEMENTKNSIAVKSIRKGDVAGVHKVKYESQFDEIEISHNAKSRKGFALGAVLAAEYIKDKTGFHTMNDMLKF
ncbi:MAG: 4-hydroxy-tetrahydrodipicolinate reductase [Bacteroidales bacterium]|jgi:4-hydroxy-tetrahydrodipicolinate reductase|nr:4-hydroxy-tetrahydrodipicolinate reductase [Bacteroidales bacterium]